MFAVTIDQKNSRHAEDRVGQLLQKLSEVPALLPFERTAGDEVQALFDQALPAVQAALIAVRLGGWSIGIGIGSVRKPLPTSTRAAAGDAFIAARTAVEQAKKRSSVPVSVYSISPAVQSEVIQADAVLFLISAQIQDRTEAEWRVIDARVSEPGASMKTLAQGLGISHQAVSKALQRSSWEQINQAIPAAASLLELVDQKLAGKAEKEART